MIQKYKAFHNWSGGKDSMLALHRIRQIGNIPIERLLTTINAGTGRNTMHGIRKSLIERQAESLEIPIDFVELEENIALPEYEKIMEYHHRKLEEDGFSHSIYGDILLGDLRDYRKKQLDRVGLKPIFPLWKEDTTDLLKEFIKAGYKAIVVCVNAKVLDQSFCGRHIDKDFLANLPNGIDPCGENGEFHTFVYDGPLFKNPVAFEAGKIVSRDYSPSKTEDKGCFADTRSWDTKFWFIDLK